MVHSGLGAVWRVADTLTLTYGSALKLGCYEVYCADVAVMSLTRCTMSVLTVAHPLPVCSRAAAYVATLIKLLVVCGGQSCMPTGAVD